MTLSHDQPGLEVAPESELHVVQAQTVNQAPPQSPGQYAYGHQPQPQPGNAYLSGAYSPSGYPPGYPPSYPAIASPSQAYWKGSQDGTHITDGDLPKPAQPTILGLRKTVFWLIFGSLIALFVVGLAIGLGVGLGVKHNDTTSGSTSSETAAPSPIACPAANGTIYDATGSTRFLVLCNVDYNGNTDSRTTDIANEGTSSIEDCINACAGMSNCKGAGWGNMDGQHTCWMKGGLGSSQSAPNWFFVIRQ
ncbi:uncharacterized protein GGS25DRAFT_1849 [Hypoxylon fragiforme]|uniref:uncharacterized protein n=1 Tax=Hypoxylon fragiforme TaxID=63214 RepID=UPI0020C6E040|nr:uncharacterized protein GGS25DRAFT_1849 [Hypoxylon fragiforme]KAI2613501.1 hypothetical protein GGS25DRAFT_1849 [Hypoxylon fragiforme]